MVNQLKVGEGRIKSAEARYSQCPMPNCETFAGRKIAFGITDSRESLAAFSWACANIVQENDTLLLVHACENATSSKSEANEILEEYQSRCLKLGFKCLTMTVTGRPVVQIAETARNLFVDLVVLGSRRRNNLMKALLGSTASKIAQKCQCPVMIVKLPKVITSSSTFGSSHPRSHQYK
jgi:nucleotide-binding universal stress UspA family protein